MENQTPTIYAVIEVKIKSHEKFLEYVEGHIPTILQYGGKFLGEFETIQPFGDDHLQGLSQWNLLVIQEWPNKETFLKWWNSPEYKQWNEMRPQGADVKLTLTNKLVH